MICCWMSLSLGLVDWSLSSIWVINRSILLLEFSFISFLKRIYWNNYSLVFP